MSEIKVDTVAEKTSANGVTVDGLNIKDSKLVTANSVVTSNVTDFNITSGKIANDAITLAKMASGTDGNIISYDASGNPVAIATGNDGQVLTSTGAGSPPAFETLAGGNTVAIAHVQDTTNYSQSNSGETVFGSGLSFTPASTSSQVVAFIEAHAGVGNDGSDNDARSLIRFYSINSSGNAIKELDSFAEFGHVNMQSGSHEIYGYFTSVISNCQRDSSNNVVIKLTAVSNQDSGTTVYLYNHRAVFMEIG